MKTIRQTFALLCLHTLTITILTGNSPTVSKIVLKAIQATSIKVNNRVYELKQEGHDIIVLSLGEAFFDIPLFPFESLPLEKIYHYSHSRGIIELRKKLCEYYQVKCNVAVSPESEIIITPGAKAAIHFSLMAILNPEDQVLIPEPAWVSYPEQAKLCGAEPIFIPCTESVFNYEKHITNKTKLLIINNPTNPNGKIFTQDELKHLVHLAKKYNFYVLSDEVYNEFVADEPFYSLGLFDQEKSHTILCNAISKNFGMSGLRIGYVITNKKLINQILKVNQHIMTCPATVLEYYLVHHFDNILQITRPQIRDLIKTRNHIKKFMNKIELPFLPGTATFYFFVSIAPSKLTSTEFCTKLLDEHHISTVPGIGYGPSCDSFIRVSTGTEPIQRIKNALLKIKEFITITS